jgi:hypothetical protein
MEPMMDEAILIRLRDMIRVQDWRNPDWLTRLDQPDEVPLFTRAQDLECFRSLDPARSGHVLLEVALAALDDLAAAVSSLPKPDSVFACLTFHDWELVRTGEQAVPTPSLFVSPKRHEELSSLRLTVPQRPEGLNVQTWLHRIERDDIFVPDSLAPPCGDEPVRVYVGYGLRFHKFASVGDYLE